MQRFDGRDEFPQIAVAGIGAGAGRDVQPAGLRPVRVGEAHRGDERIHGTADHMRGIVDAQCHATSDHHADLVAEHTRRGMDSQSVLGLVHQARQRVGNAGIQRADHSCDAVDQSLDDVAASIHQPASRAGHRAPDGSANPAHADQYVAPEGQYTTVHAVDGTAWYKQYAVDAVDKSPYMAPDGSIAFNESIVKKLPPAPRRKDKI